ncbi:MAG: AbrB/MazE/SpoVT family DNA-binding domain-containing protein [Clostridia bacterium]|nr:AbrB/MazE/SpoVT family DNA-binding domain-containing protein [Clostridia bacterium]
MKETEKRIDELGRVVIPIKMRKKLNITDKSTVLVYLDDNSIIITPKERCCALCGKTENINSEIRLCVLCIDLIKKYEEHPQPH